MISNHLKSDRWDFSSRASDKQPCFTGRYEHTPSIQVLPNRKLTMNEDINHNEDNCYKPIKSLKRACLHSSNTSGMYPLSQDTTSKNSAFSLAFVAHSFRLVEVKHPKHTLSFASVDFNYKPESHFHQTSQFYPIYMLRVFTQGVVHLSFAWFYTF